jgi:hypothetical protein
MTAAARDVAVRPAFRPTLPLTISRLWRSCFTIDPQEAILARRGFPTNDPAARRRLECIGETFLLGFNQGLQADDAERLWDHVETVSHEQRGFVVEGCTMGVVIADALTFGDRRLGPWMIRSGEAYTYLAHVGIGWGLARVPCGVPPFCGMLIRFIAGCFSVGADFMTPISIRNASSEAGAVDSGAIAHALMTKGSAVPFGFLRVPT